MARTRDPWAEEDRAVKAMQKRREAERRNDERAERAQLAAERREKARKLREERPEVYWIRMLAWSIWVFIGVETIKTIIEIMP